MADKTWMGWLFVHRRYGPMDFSRRADQPKWVPISFNTGRPFAGRWVRVQCREVPEARTSADAARA